MIDGIGEGGWIRQASLSAVVVVGLLPGCAPPAPPPQGTEEWESGIEGESSVSHTVEEPRAAIWSLVPPAAPIHTPPGFYEEDNVRYGWGCLPGNMLRGIVVVRFRESASRAERQAAIDLIDGEVVGGRGPVLGGEGFYYVRVEDDPKERALCDALMRLNVLPQVDVAMPYMVEEEPDTTRPSVPPTAPNDIPRGLYQDIRHGSACVSGPMVRATVVVIFREGTTQREKQAAIDLVRGEVVGGIRGVAGLEGYYYVRVEDDPEGWILCRAVSRLDGLPQVALASPVTFVGIND